MVPPVALFTPGACGFAIGALRDRAPGYNPTWLGGEVTLLGQSEVRRRLLVVRDDLVQGRLSVALRGLLEVWAATRHPAIADRIWNLDARLPLVRPPLDLTPTGAVSPSAWLGRAVAGHPADVTLLGDTLLDNVGRPTLAKRLSAFEQLPPDPRAYGALLRAWRRRRGRLPSFARALLRHVDPSASAPERLQLPPEVLREVDQWRARGLPRVDEALASLTDATRRALQLPLSDAWTELPPARCDDQLDALWRAVVAEADDDGPRHVFADRLGDRDEQLAAFVRLQLAAGRRPLTVPERGVVRAVLRQRVGDLLGPLGGAVVTKGLKFERGFLHAATVLTTARESRALGDDFRWGTARALACRHAAFFEGQAVRELFSAGTRYLPSTLASGEEVWAWNAGGSLITPAVLRALAKKHVTPRWRTLQLDVSRSESVSAIELPALETLILEGIRPFGLPRMPRLRWLVVSVRAMTWRNLPTELERLTLVLSRGWQQVFDRHDPDGRTVWTGRGRPPKHGEVSETYRRGLSERVADAGFVFR